MTNHAASAFESNSYRPGGARNRRIFKNEYLDTRIKAFYIDSELKFRLPQWIGYIGR